MMNFCIFNILEDNFLFAIRVVRCWSRLPGEVVDAPGGVWGWIGWGPGQPGLVLDMEVGGLHVAEGLDSVILMGPFQLGIFCDSMIL